MLTVEMYVKVNLPRKRRKKKRLNKSASIQRRAILNPYAYLFTIALKLLSFMVGFGRK